MGTTSRLLAGLLLALAALLPGAGPAQAAVPNVWAFAYMDNASPPMGYVMSTAHQWGSYKTNCPNDWGTVSNPAAGIYRVSFPCTAGYPGIVHVTAVDATGGFCQSGNWLASGRAELITVWCFDAAGVAANTRFTVLYTASTGSSPIGSHAYVHADAGGATITDFNSTGMGNVVTRLAPGRYRVEMPVPSPGTYTGNFQATAVTGNLTARHCRVADWSLGRRGYLIYLACTDRAGTDTDSAFTLSHHNKRAVYGVPGPPLNLGYLLHPVSGAPMPDTNYNSVVGPNTATVFAPGEWDVVYPGVGVRETHMQVTAYSGRPLYCQLSDVWTINVTDVEAHTVACFAPGGAPTPGPFFATYASSA
ncbi:hypothetical protein AB0I81_39690 [Nonomuraea sp. NPDC050404]|uniref:hypothetical protein n=1 Tax=Nonomuraea sp. NPDC050404 TaxID=3155783 RepID=UPI003411B02E